jgi:hypothetical protein
MKKAFIYSLFVLIFSPLIASAETSTSAREINYQLCKKNSSEKKERTMAPVLKAYAASSEMINEKTKNDFDSIKWYMESAYAAESKKIEEKRNRSMESLSNKVARTRLIAQATWKAEDALCEFTFASTKDTVKKSSKNN